MRKMRKLNLTRFNEFEGTREEGKEYFANLVKRRDELNKIIDEWSPEMLEIIKEDGKYENDDHSVELLVRTGHVQTKIDTNKVKAEATPKQLASWTITVEVSDSLVKKVIG